MNSDALPEYSNLMQTNENSNNSNNLIPIKHKFGIEGYELSRQAHLDRKERTIINWKNTKV